jgi:hypothetical protein
MRYRLILSLILALCLALACSRNTVISAGSSGTGNAKVSGVLFKKDGAPASSAKVLLLPSTFDPLNDSQQSITGGVFIDTTDVEGNYVFSDIPKDTYSIEAKGILDGTKVLMENIEVAGESVRVEDGVLQKPGAIKLMLPAGIDTVNGYVYIPGTDIYSLTDKSADSVVLDSVPAATGITVNYSLIGTTLQPKRLAENISVVQESTVTIEYSAWLYSKKLYFNTTESGANVDGNVVNFPVLIRLNSLNFNFTQAKPGGADVRFANQNNVFLPYEIERWDAANGQAEVWVKVDTVVGNSDSRYMIFYWGNAKAASAGNGAAVFDTSSGFQGVWHLKLGTDQKTTDATGNSFIGAANNVAGTEGLIGPACQFDGKSSFVTMPNTASGKLNFPENGTYAISAWVNVADLDSNYHAILMKSTGQYGLQINETNFWSFTEFHANVGWDGTSAKAVARQWVYVVGVRSDKRQYLYINGVLADTLHAASDNIVGSRTTDYDICIGKRPNYSERYFAGMIDEVRIMNRSEDGNRIRLEYMNQRGDDKLVMFK